MHRLFSVSAVVLAGFFGHDETTFQLLQREVGRTVADVTLTAGLPDEIADMPDGRRAFRWQRWSLNPRGGSRCNYTLLAEQEGSPESLAAWRVVEIEPPAPGCGPEAEPDTFL